MLPVKVAVVKCSAGIDYIAEDLITLDPQQTSNLSFTMHSIYSIGKINKCDGRKRSTFTQSVALCLPLCLVELSNQNGELLDNMTVFFETEDTCFCYDQCGCVVS